MDKFILFTMWSILLLSSNSAQKVNCVRFTIVPSVSTPCLSELTGVPCITLQQYIANPSRTDVTLDLQPGNHHLDSQLAASSIDSFTMSANTMASVICNQQMQGSSFKWLSLNQLQNVYISGITFIGCTMTVARTANATIVRTSFVDRAICCYSGLITFSSSSAMVDQCIFTNNRGSFRAIIYASYSDVTVDHTTFTNNYYDDDETFDSNGGAIHLSNGQLTILNSNFSDNNATGIGHGGAIYVNGGELTIAGSCFINNTAGPENAHGGAVFFSGGNITVLNSTFVGNTASNGGGGAIYSARRYTNVSLINSTFSYNSAAFCGVLDVDEFNHCNIDFTGSVFTYNKASGQVTGNDGGGVFCVRNGSISVQDSIFSHNIAVGNAGVSITDESNILIKRSNFTNNTAMGDGGVFYTYFYSTRYTITQSFFTNNQAGSDGGIMYVGRAGSQVSLVGNTVAGNQASDRGGVISIIGSSLHIAGDNSIYENTAQLGEIASACSSVVMASSVPIAPRQDPVHSQCILYDSSNTTLPPITAPPITSTTPETTTENGIPITTTISPPVTIPPPLITTSGNDTGDVTGDVIAPTTPPVTTTNIVKITTPSLKDDDNGDLTPGNIIAYISLGVSGALLLLVVIVIIIMICTRKPFGQQPHLHLPNRDEFNLNVNASYQRSTQQLQPGNQGNFDYTINASYQRAETIHHAAILQNHYDN